MAVAGSSPVKHKSIEFKLDLKEKKNENIMFSYLLKKKMALHWISTETSFIFPILHGQQCRWCFTLWDFPFQ